MSDSTNGAFENATNVNGESKIRICVDADGGDDAPEVVVNGVILALAEDPNLSILLVGRESSIGKVVADFPDRIEPIYTTEVIEMGDHPTSAVRRKKDSSIVVGCKAVHEGRADGFYSAGSTGACLTAATLFIGRVTGAKRPALATIVPVPGKPTVLVDCGANADCKPEYMLQFAHMGRAYSQIFLGIDDPKVGLLNNGSEDTKGSNLAKAAHELMAQELPSFYRNIEGRDITSGTCEVIVTDGFTGNVALKVMEGTASMVFHALKGVLTSSFGNKLAAAKIKPDLKGMIHSWNPDTYGGAPLLGTRKVCIVGHGSSSADGIKNGIAACALLARAELPEKIASALVTSEE